MHVVKQFKFFVLDLTNFRGMLSAMESISLWKLLWKASCCLNYAVDSHLYKLQLVKSSVYPNALPRVINFNFLFQFLTRDISYSMENLAKDSLLRGKLIEQSFLTTSLNHFRLEWLGEFALSLGLKGLTCSPYKASIPLHMYHTHKGCSCPPWHASDYYSNCTWSILKVISFWRAAIALLAAWS